MNVWQILAKLHDRTVFPVKQQFNRFRLNAMGIQTDIGFKAFGHHSLTVSGSGSFRIGKNVSIGREVMIRVGDNGSVEISDDVQIQDFGCILCGGHLKIGKGSILVNGVSIYCDGNINIGEYVVTAAYTHIMDVDHQTADLTRPILLQGLTKPRPVVIGDDVWFGAKCTVAPGVTIGSHAIIGAHSFVNRDIPEYAVAVGSPARVIKFRNKTVGGDENAV